MLWVEHVEDVHRVVVEEHWHENDDHDVVGEYEKGIKMDSDDAKVILKK